MAKYAVSFGSAVLTLTDKKGNPVEFAYEHALSLSDSLELTKAEQKKRGDVVRAHLSMLCMIMGHTRLSGYKGKTPIGDKLPAILKEAIRETEVLVIKPAFIAPIFAKCLVKDSSHDASEKDKAIYQKVVETADNAWDDYIKGLRDGMYARYKSIVTIYFAYFGLLPCVYNADGTPDTSRLLSVTAMEKLIANAKTDLAKEENEGISLALSKIKDELNARNEKTVIGDIGLALAYVADITATLLAIQRDNEAKKAEQNHVQAVTIMTQAQINAKNAEPAVKAGDVDALAKSIVQTAKGENKRQIA
jgi:hypothetical protein